MAARHNTLTKTGTVNLKEKTVEWSSEVTGNQLGNNADLKGFKFSDDLIDVGEYVPNSFKVGGVSVTPQINGSKIEYTFPDGSISPDLSRILPGECPCGRTFRRMERILGRSDDMLIIKGVNVFPMQIEKVLFEVEDTEPM